MEEALKEAAKAAARGEVPVGAVAVHEGRVIGRGHNLREISRDPSAHAELTAMRAAAAYLSSWRLVGVTIYVTLEPCPMCAERWSTRASSDSSTARTTPRQAP